MRLIDAEPIERDITEWKARETNEPLTKTIVDNVGTWVTHAPTIDAIPISWLNSKGMTMINNEARTELFKLIRAWREEGKENGG